MQVIFLVALLFSSLSIVFVHGYHNYKSMLDIEDSEAKSSDMDDDQEFETYEFEMDAKDHEAFKREAPNAYRQRALVLHNQLRARHGSPPLVLDDKLSREAQAWAESESKTKVQQHSCNPCDQYGENLYNMWSTGKPMGKTEAIETACQQWYDEIKDYNFRSPNLSNFGKWGHFTALVWKATRKMGVGVAFRQQRSVGGEARNYVYVVARYFPPVNNFSILKQNVNPKRY